MGGFSRLFKNITWPQAMIYNITPEQGAKIQGSADVQHHFLLPDFSQETFDIPQPQITEEMNKCFCLCPEK